MSHGSTFPLFPPLSVPPSLSLLVVSCFPASSRRLDSQSAEGHSHRRITHPPPPGCWEPSFCLRPSNQQGRQTGNLPCRGTACGVCVCVCVSQRFSTCSVPPSPPLCVCVLNYVWWCQGGGLRGRRDLFKSAKASQLRCMCVPGLSSPARETRCVCVCMCVEGGVVLTRLWVDLRGRARRCWVELRGSRAGGSVRGAAMGLGQSSKAPVTDDTDEGE